MFGYKILQSWSFVGKVFPDFVAIRVLSMSNPKTFDEGWLSKLKNIIDPTSFHELEDSALVSSLFCALVIFEGRESGCSDDF